METDSEVKRWELRGVRLDTVGSPKGLGKVTGAQQFFKFRRVMECSNYDGKFNFPAYVFLEGRMGSSSLRYNLGSTGSLSSASTPKTHSCTRVRGSCRIKRSRDSIPNANSRKAKDRLAPRPRWRSSARCSGAVYSAP